MKKGILLAALLGACAVIGLAASGDGVLFGRQAMRDDGDGAAFASNAASKPAKAKQPYGQDPADYVLTFAEEFDGLDRTLWNDHIWYETSSPTSNYAVEKGVLKIWPQRDASGKFFNRTLDTDGRFEQRYGYFEMEAKLPRGKGTWPAFWLLAHPDRRRPEIDIMEAYPGGVEPWGYTDKSGVSRPTAYGTTVWIDEGVKADGFQYDARTDLSAKFNKYAVKWEPNKQTFYFNGKKIFAVNAAMNDRMYIILDLWFGSASGEPDESTPEGKANSFEVNYVRAWQFRRNEAH
ncbi:MAG: glycoside hydrolase family 16 protein [Noviherbaspirillum sp.]